MKFTEIGFLVVLVLAGSLPCNAQDTEQPVNTFKIRRKEASLEAAATRYFNLYCAEKVDTITAEFFLDKNTYTEILRQTGLFTDESKLRKMLAQYDTLKLRHSVDLIQQIEGDKNHDHPLSILVKDSFSFRPLGPEILGGAARNTKLDFYITMVHCSENNRNHHFCLFSWIKHHDRWYLLDEGRRKFAPTGNLDVILNEIREDMKP